MKLITYNIGDGGDGHIKKIVNTLNKETPDFVALIEATDFDKDDMLQLKEISERIGLTHYHLVLSTKSKHHIALISKYPLIITNEMHSFKKVGVVASLETEFGNISIAVAHLAPNTESTRLDELSELLPLLEKHNLRIILGDLNSLSEKDKYSLNELYQSIDSGNNNTEEPRYDVINKLERAGYFDAAVLDNKQGECTVPITHDGDLTYKNLRLDYIFLSEHLLTNFSSYRVIKNSLTKNASDHFPIVVELKKKNSFPDQETAVGIV
jgi:exodeoxyribonuclease III